MRCSSARRLASIILVLTSQPVGALSLVQVPPAADADLEPFEELQEGAAELQGHLVAASKGVATDFRAERALLEARLAAQDAEAIEARRRNSALADQLQVQQQASRERRRSAEALRAECRQLAEEARKLQVNLTSARDYSTQALEAGDEAREAPELAVLEELSQQDALDQDARLRAREENEVLGIPVSLLQLEEETDDDDAAGDDDEASEEEDEVEAGPAARELVESLLASADDLQRERAAASSRLRASFQEESRKRGEVLRVLAEERSRLEAAVASEVELTRRLSAAEGRLRKTRDDLQRRKERLLSYVASSASFRGRRAV